MSSGILGLRDGCPPRCLAPSGLWLAWDACPCVSIELNCAQRNLTGNEPALSDILLALANAEVSILILNHCNDLVVPTAILQFPSLLGIHIYNSQLKDWSADAGVTAHYFTRLGYVLFVRTNLTQVPKALLSDLPSTLVDIEFVASATAIAFPQDVATRWTQLTTLYIEHCNLTELPSEILQMPNLDQLSLAGNHITELPSDLFSTPASRSIRYLLLNGNPLSQLPQHLEDAVKLKELYLDGTNVPVVPQTTTELHISAEDSSLCHGSAHHDTRVRCEGLHAGIYVSGAYPLDPRERSRRKANLLSTLIA
ncbi:TPA: hypothetical protein N0F65_009461 [Lagenidium giganteum]|uniref:Uncharacterized protein n=1 Tax=Lagenidium giganteum TaxID=4803 RepID=A0AAV2Z9V7_9STRA|nr:TPA: hypothetical protein N0F65_009461 [Lagenidium giganteum]